MSEMVCGVRLKLPGTKIDCVCKRAPGHHPETQHLCGFCHLAWDPEPEPAEPTLF